MPSPTPLAALLSRKSVRFLILVPVGVIVIGAVAVAGLAMVENIRFARATEQVLGVATMAHNLAITDRNFAAQAGEDLVRALARVGYVRGVTDGQPSTLTNPWLKPIRLTAMLPSIMRLETDLPTRDCRRLAMFFIKNSGAARVRVLEARAGNLWKRFYDSLKPPPDEKAVDAACGRADEATLAVVFVLQR